MQKKRNFFLIFGFLVSTAIAVGVVNAFLGVLVHFFNPAQNIFYHILSPYIFLFLFLLVSLNIIYKYYRYHRGGHAIAQYLQAIQLDAVNGTPEEISVYRLNQEIAEECGVVPAAIYLFEQQLGINALTVGFSEKDVCIILTWGSLQAMNHDELKGMLSFEYCKIINGDYIENSKIDILFSGFLFFCQLGSYIIVHSTQRKALLKNNNLAAISVALGGFIWLLGWLGVLLSRLFKFCYLFGRVYQLDYQASDLIDANILLHTLTRMYVHNENSCLYRVDSEALYHYCFANALSEQSWFKVHPSLVRRIYNLHPNYEPKKINPNDKRYVDWQKLIEKILLPTNEEILLTLLDQQNNAQNLPLLRLAPLNQGTKDAVRPLTIEVRQNMDRPELLKRAMQTSTGCREVIMAIFIIRQYRDSIPIEIQASKAIVEALLKIDERIHIQIFYEALNQIGNMPRIMSRQFIAKLVHIIQADGEIGLLDCLLLERLKAHLNLLEETVPIARLDCAMPIVILVDALLHVQPLNPTINQQHLRLKLLRRILTEEEIKTHVKVSEAAVDLEYSLRMLSGLLERERLYLLTIIEHGLWSDTAITQQELDVLELLYWRLGFKTNEIVARMIKQNSLLIL